MKTIRVFISSPGDVRPERLIARGIVERLDREFGYHARIEAVMWERQPLVATEHFQTMITPPSATDIVVVILWSRLGTPLPAELFQRLDGTTGVTGTEWEFEDAVRSYRESGSPDLLVYRKRSAVMARLDDEAELESQREQKRMLDRFLREWIEGGSDGSVKAASHSFTASEEFAELLLQHLRELIRAHLQGSGTDDAPPSVIRWHDGSPFRGLEVFELSHAAVFFGRVRARRELRELLAERITRRRAFVLVFGASGSGKSSLVRAGLLPDITTPGMIDRVGLCRYALQRPSDHGGELFAALAAALAADHALPELAELDWGSAVLAAHLQGNAALASQPLRQALRRAGERAGLLRHAEARLCLVVDQLEELFTTPAISDAARAAYVHLLRVLAESGLVWVIATMRSDFFDRMEQVPDLVALADGAQYRLLAPEPAEIGQMIRGPAAEAGLTFDIDPASGLRLDAVLQEAAAHEAASLPLLEFTLDELWRARDGHGKLSFAAYRRIGGLEGALARRAEEVFAGQPAQHQAALPGLLRALVSIEQQAGASVTARTAARAMAGGSPDRAALLDAFVAARLIVASEGPGAQTGGGPGGGGQGGTVRIAHEALLTAWPRAHELISADREFLRVRARVEAASQLWETAGRPADLLLPPGRPLAEAVELLARRAELDQGTLAFITASADAEAARRRAGEEAARSRLRRTRILAAAFGVLGLAAALAGAFAFDRGQTAERQRQVAVQAQQEADQQRQSAEASAKEAGQQRARAEQQTAQAEAARAEAERQRQAAVDERARALSSQSRFLSSIVRQETDAGNAGTALRLALEALPRDLAAPDRPVVPEALNALGYAVANNRERGVLRGHTGTIVSGGFSPDGTRAVTTSTDKTARLWDVRNGTLVRTLTGHQFEVMVAAFDPTGRVLATAGDSVVRLWNAVTGAPLGTLEGHSRQVMSLSFSADGRFLLSGAQDNTARLWNVQTRTSAGVMTSDPCCGLTGRASPLATTPILQATTTANWRIFGSSALSAISPDGTLAVTAGYLDEEAAPRVWSLPDLKITARLRGHAVGIGFQINAVAFDPTGLRIVTAGGDGTARIWNARTGTPVAVLRGHEARVLDAHFSPDGRHVVTGGDDRTARIWDAVSGAQIAVLRGHDDIVWGAQFDPTGTLVLTSANDGTARLWNAADGTPVATLGGHAGKVWLAAFSRDGGTILTGAQDFVGRLWRTRVLAAPSQIHAPPAGLALPGALGQRRLAFGANGGRLLAESYARFAGEPESVTLIDSRLGLRLASLEGSDGRFLGVTGLIRTTGVDGATMLWNADDGHAAGSIPEPLAISPDSSHAASVAAGTTRVSDLKAPQSGVPIAGPPAQLALFSPDGRVLALAAGDAVRVADAATGAVTAELRGHSAPVTRLTIDATGTWLATRTNDGQARIWHLPEGGAALDLGADVKELAFSQDGTRALAEQGDHAAVLWDLTTGKAVGRIATRPRTGGGFETALLAATLATPLGQDTATAERSENESPALSAPPSSKWTSKASPFLPDGHTLLGADGQLFSADTAARLPIRVGQTGRVQPRAWAPSGSRMIAPSASGGVDLIDTRPGAASGTVLAHLAETDLTDASADPSGSRLAAIDAEGVPHLWELDGGRPIGAPDTRGAKARAIGFSGDGLYLLVTLETGAVLRFAALDGGQPTALAPSGTMAGTGVPVVAGRMAALRDSAGDIQLWDVPQATLLRTLHAETALGNPAFTAGASRIFATDQASGGHLFDPRTGADIPIGHHADGSGFVSLGPGGNWVADNTGETVALWNARTGAAVPGLPDGAPWQSIEADADGQHLFALTQSGEIHVFDGQAWHAEAALRLVAPDLRPPVRNLYHATPNRAGTADPLSGLRLEPVLRPGFALARMDGRTVLIDRAGHRVIDLDHAEPKAPLAEIVTSPDGAALLVSRSEAPPVAWRLDQLDRGGFVLDAPIWNWAAAFADDGHVLAVGGPDHTLRVWDMIERRRLAVLPGADYPVMLASTPAGAVLDGVALDGIETIWNDPALPPLLRLAPDRNQAPASALSAAWSDAGGQRLVIESSDQTLAVWNTGTGAMVKPLAASDRFGGDTVVRMAGRAVLALTRLGSVRLSTGGAEVLTLQTATHNPRDLFGESGRNTVVLDDAGQRALAGVDDHPALYDATTGARIAMLTPPNGKAVAALDPGGQLAASVDAEGVVRIWRARDGVLTASLSSDPIAAGRRPTALNGGPTALAFSRDAARLAVLTGSLFSFQRQGLIADPATGTVLTDHVLAASPDATHLLRVEDGTDTSLPLGGTDRRAIIANAATGDVLADMAVPLRGHGQLNLGGLAPIVAPAPGPIAMVPAAETVQLWSRTDGSQIGAPLVHDDLVTAMRFTPDGGTLVTATRSGRLTAWDATTGQQRSTIEVTHERGLIDLAVAPGGDRVVTYDSAGHVWLWTPGQDRAASLAASVDSTVSAYSSTPPVSFSPDGSRLVVWTGTGLALFDGHDGKTVSAAIAGPFNTVPSWRFTADSNRIVIAPVSGPPLVLDGQSGLKPAGQPPALKDANAFRALDPSTRRVLANVLPNQLAVWDAGTGARLATLAPADAEVSTAWLMTGGHVLARDEAHRIVLWDGDDGHVMARIDAGEGATVAPSPDGSVFLVLRPRARTAELWDAATGQRRHVLTDGANEIRKAWFDPTGSAVLLGLTGQRVQVFDVAHASMGAPIPINLEPSDDNVQIVPRDGTPGLLLDRFVSGRLLDAMSGGSISELRAQVSLKQPGLAGSGEVSAAAVSDDGTLGVIGTDEGAVLLMRPGSDTPALPLRGHSRAISQAALLGATIATRSDDGTVKLWRVADGGLVATLTHPDGPVARFVASPDGRRIVTLPTPSQANAAAPKQAVLWDGQTGARIGNLTGQRGMIVEALFSDNAAVLLSRDGTQQIVLHNAVTGAVTGTVSTFGSNVLSMAISSDGRRLLAGTSLGVTLWSGPAETPIAIPLKAQATRVAFSGSGALAASGSAAGEIAVLDAATGDVLRQFPALGDRASVLAFSPDDQRLAVGLTSGDVRIWQIDRTGLGGAPSWQQLIDYADVVGEAALSDLQRRRFFLDAPARPQVPPATASDCDALAADPADQQKRAPGVLVLAIRATEAIAACQEAASASDAARYRYQQGRALEAAKRMPDSAAAYRAAAEAGYPRAMIVWHNILLSGFGNTTRDAEAAASWLRKAAEAGSAQAKALVGLEAWNAPTATAADKQAARTLMQRSADLGDARGNYFMAVIAANEGAVDESVLRFLLARRLAVDQRQDDIPPIAVDRLRFLMRQIPDERMLKVLATARSWKPSPADPG